MSVTAVAHVSCACVGHKCGPHHVLMTPACMGMRLSRAGLTATLFEYQRRALAWLLQREGAGLPRSRSAAGAAAAESTAGGHPCWRAVRLPAGNTVFVSLLTGALLPGMQAAVVGRAVEAVKHTHELVFRLSALAVAVCLLGAQALSAVMRLKRCSILVSIVYTILHIVYVVMCVAADACLQTDPSMPWYRQPIPLLGVGHKGKAAQRHGQGALMGHIAHEDKNSFRITSLYCRGGAGAAAGRAPPAARGRAGRRDGPGQDRGGHRALPGASAAVGRCGAASPRCSRVSRASCRQRRRWELRRSRRAGSLGSGRTRMRRNMGAQRLRRRPASLRAHAGHCHGRAHWPVAARGGPPRMSKQKAGYIYR